MIAVPLCLLQLATRRQITLEPLRFLLALVEAQREGRGEPLRSSAFLAGTLLKKCLTVLAEYRAIYSTNTSHSARSYNEQYRVVDSAASRIVDTSNDAEVLTENMAASNESH